MLRRSRRLLVLAVVLAVLLCASLLPSLLDEKAGERPGSPPVGRIRSAAGGPPPPGLRIAAWGERFLEELGPGPDGAFRFGEGSGGATELRIRWGDRSVRVPAEDGPAEILLPGDRDEPPPEWVDVSGRVVSAAEEAPLPGAVVRLGEREALSDARGRFHLGRLPAPGAAGPHLEVRAPGHRTLYVLAPADAGWDDLFLRLLRR